MVSIFYLISFEHWKIKLNFPKYHLRFTCDLAKKHHYHCIFYTSCEKSIKNNMENLPVEILEVVFRPLSKKEDIENCFNANSKWRQIIENMFSKKSIPI